MNTKDTVEELANALIEYAEEVDKPEERYQLVKFEVKEALTKAHAEGVAEAVEQIKQEIGELHSGVASLIYEEPVSNDWRHGYEQCRKDALSATKV